jgi:hypothetical protein
MIHQRTRLEDDKSSTSTAGMRGKSKRLENGKEQKKKKTPKKIMKNVKLGGWPIITGRKVN